MRLRVKKDKAALRAALMFLSLEAASDFSIFLGTCNISAFLDLSVQNFISTNIFLKSGTLFPLDKEEITKRKSLLVFTLLGMLSVSAHDRRPQQVTPPV